MAVIIQLPALNLPGLTTSQEFRFYEFYPRGQVQAETAAQLAFLYELSNQAGSRLLKHNITLPKKVIKKASLLSKSNKVKLEYSKFLRLRNAYYKAMVYWAPPGTTRDSMFGLKAVYMNGTIVLGYYLNTQNWAYDGSFIEPTLEQEYWWAKDNRHRIIPGVTNRLNSTLSLTDLLSKITTNVTYPIVIHDIYLNLDIPATPIQPVQPIIIQTSRLIDGYKFTTIVSVNLGAISSWGRMGDNNWLYNNLLTHLSTFMNNIKIAAEDYLQTNNYIDIANGVSKLSLYIASIVGGTSYGFYDGDTQLRHDIEIYKPDYSSRCTYSCRLYINMYVHIEDV